jgi:hypothetical protein
MRRWKGLCRYVGTDRWSKTAQNCTTKQNWNARRPRKEDSEALFRFVRKYNVDVVLLLIASYLNFEQSYRSANLHASLHLVCFLSAFARFDLLTPHPPQCENHTRTLSPRQKAAGSRHSRWVGESHAPLRQPVPSLFWAVRSRKQKWRKSDIRGSGWTTQTVYRSLWSSVAFQGCLSLLDDAFSTVYLT